MSSDEPETLQPKGESLVKHCPICGVEFDEIVQGVSGITTSATNTLG